MKPLDLEAARRSMLEITDEMRSIDINTASQEQVAGLFVAYMLTVGGAITGALLDIANTTREGRDALVAIAKAQDAMVKIATADLNEEIAAAIEKGVDEGIKNRDSQRSFLGKQPNG